MDQEPFWTALALRRCTPIKRTSIPTTRQGLALQLMNKWKSWKKFSANKGEDPFLDPEPSPMTMIHPIVTELRVVIRNTKAVHLTLRRSIPRMPDLLPMFQREEPDKIPWHSTQLQNRFVQPRVMGHLPLWIGTRRILKEVWTSYYEGNFFFVKSILDRHFVKKF